MQLLRNDMRGGSITKRLLLQSVQVSHDGFDILQKEDLLVVTKKNV